MLSVDWLSVSPFSIDKEILEKWIDDCVASENKVFGDVSLILCSDEELLEMNIRYLNHDYYTDIITFDYCENKIVSGDLFVSIDRVRDNAETLSLLFETELNRVVIHGVLHLCGYGDKSDDEEVLMREKENFYLNKLKGFT